MRPYWLFIVLWACAGSPLFSQTEIRQVREGNQRYENKQFSESEVSYRKAMEADAGSFRARFNLGDAMYKQGKFQESAELFADLAASEKDPSRLAGVYHNLGNSLLKSNKLQESVEAYKNSLRMNPADEETRYNLAYAQKLLQQQQNQKKNNQNKDQKDQKEQKDQKDEKQQENENQKQSENKNQQQQQQQDQKGNEQNQKGKTGMTKEEANRILQALQNNEKQTREKINKQQFRSKKIKTEKDW